MKFTVILIYVLVHTIVAALLEEFFTKEPAFFAFYGFLSAFIFIGIKEAMESKEAMEAMETDIRLLNSDKKA